MEIRAVYMKESLEKDENMLALGKRGMTASGRTLKETDLD